MTAFSEDCLAAGLRSPLRIREALDLILACLASMVDSEEVPLRAAVSRVLAEEVIAGIDVPGADNSAVDGYAVHFDDLNAEEQTRLAVIGRAAAGHVFAGAMPRGVALRIFTGALMPPGADTVVMQEDCQREGDVIDVPPGLKRGSNRRKAGEDVRAGTGVLPLGIRLRAQDVGLAAAVGRTRLRVGRPLRVALFSADQEAGETSIPAGLSAAGLGAHLRRLGVAMSDLGRVSNEVTALQAALAGAAAGHDVLLATGKISRRGGEDVRRAITTMGFFYPWNLAVEPECALGLGELRAGDRRTILISLPEDAMCAMITFLFIVRPMLMRLMGRRDEPLRSYRLRAGFAHVKGPGRQAFRLARLERDEAGEPIAIDCPPASIPSADGVIELPETLTRIEPGATVDFFPFSEAGA
jgi:molybdopterin molybdotransferase